jgi:multicomponent Na+:H+ antiporter subunit C
MELILALTIGVLFAAAAFLLLRRSIVRMILGVVVLSQAVNLLIFVASGVTPGKIPFVAEGASTLPPETADPVPQALILTAIVISFGVLAFTLAMSLRADQTVGTDDLDEMKSTDA